MQTRVPLGNISNISNKSLSSVDNAKSIAKKMWEKYSKGGMV